MEHKTLIPYSTYIMIWFALLLLTGITVTVTGVNLGKWSVLAAIVIAGYKGLLVVLYFMNLKYEELQFKIMLLVALSTLAIILVITFTDILFR